MSQRNKQHMGRSTEEGQELVGRDVRAGDVTADQANGPADLPMPNEEGSNYRAANPPQPGGDAQGDGDEGRRGTR